jgi:Flp pilus assembly protein TadD
LVDALRLDPQDPLIHNALGVVLHALGKKKQARSCFERALQLAPGLPEARDNLRLL